MHSTRSWVSRARHAIFVLLGAASVSVAQQTPAVRVAGPPGEAVYVSQAHKDSNDAYGYAGAFRAGDFVFVSGVVVGAWQGDVLDDEGLRTAVRAAFENAGRTLDAAGAGYEDVVEIVSFHIWNSAHYDGDKASQLDAIVDVKREFMEEPDPAWTAVGTTELVPDRGIMEIRLTAYAPIDR